MLKNNIGDNAGIIWQLLNEQLELPVKDLHKMSGLSKENFYMSIGWLAREGNISFHEKDNNLMVSWIY